MNISSTSLESSFTSAVSLEMALFGSLIASPTVGPDMSAITGPRLTSLLRSHSHTLSRAGLPKLVRNPSGSWV